MKYGYLRAAAASPALKVADPAYNAARICEVIRAQAERGTELLVFPELSLSGYTCGDLFLQKTLTDGCLKALLQIAEATAGKKMLVFVGLPVVCEGKLYNCAAGIANGKVEGIVPKTYLPNYNEFYEERHFSRGFGGEAYVRFPDGSFAPMSVNFLFTAQGFEELTVACEICEDVWVADPPSTRHAQRGATVIVNLSASNETIGKREYRKTLLSSQSGRNVCAYVYADAGMDESTSDMVFAGNSMIYENGTLLAESAPFSGEVCEAELDVDFLLAERRRLNTFKTCYERGSEGSYFWTKVDFWTEELPAPDVSPMPFVPAEEGARNERAELILNMQAHALAKRLAHTNARTAVIGISGGLDSTLALLVTARAFDLLKKDRADICAYTMPGFGTTGRTKGNSLALMKAMGVTARTVRISDTVLRHFKDIGHDPAVLNAAYENAQARYRTMILMDAANETGGLVVGTGDLSELALGWCTYNGDHMSMYAVNCSVPKTLVKHLVRAEAER
ncbi:MAG TPA: NAD(+) synthase, partial [Firmicutes bacterium]|nr:NAD(+) synthase [Bacillota bacterium]